MMHIIKKEDINNLIMNIDEETSKDFEISSEQIVDTWSYSCDRCYKCFCSKQITICNEGCYCKKCFDKIIVTSLQEYKDFLASING